MIGRTLDRYRIESKLGEGAMGVVFAARDTRLDRLVAIKVLPPDAVASDDRARRFVQEAKAASALNHPGIVVVHDIRSDDGVDFIVMEYLAGRTLDRVIPAHGLPIDQALRYAVAIADAVAAAHGAGIVHRDLKPSNVMVTDDDRIKVLDFGLAKLLDEATEGSAVATRSAAATAPGTVLGSAAYMSPEQAEGRTVDARADVFSFGVMLYEMLTGRRPFSGDTAIATLTRIIHDEPLPPSQLTPLVSPELDRTVLRSLRKDRDRRFQSMADLKVALQDLATESRTNTAAPPRPAPVPSPARRSPWPWLGAATAALLAAGVYLTMGREPPADDAAPLVAVPLTSAPGTKRTPSFSVDGTQVAYSWTGADQNNVDVYVQQVGADAPLRLTTDPGNDASPAWSPDGRTIAFLRRREGTPQLEVRLIAPLGGPERKLIEIAPRSNVRTQTLAWCADSSCVVVADTTGPGKPNALFVVAIASGDKRQLTQPDTTFGDCDPAVSPDGRWLIFRREAAPFSGELYRLALGPDMSASGEPIRATTTQLGAYNARWTPDSREILFAARSALWRLAFTPGAEPRRLPFVGQDGAMPATSSVRPGDPARLVYVRSFADTNIVGLRLSAPGAPATAPAVATIASTRRDDSPHVSTDGRRITFVSDRSGQPEVWMSDVTGAAAVPLTSMGANPGFPRWTPDGGSVVFQSNPDGNGDVFIVSADGGRPRNLTSHPSSDVFPSVSRDGRSIYFSSTRSGEAAIWKMPVEGGTPVRVSAGVSQLAIESPDGADVYYVQSGVAIGAGPLMRQPVTGGPAVNVLDDVATTSFDVIDSGIYYIERTAAAARLRFFDFASRQSTVIGDDLGTLAFGFTASPDGRTILFARVDSSVDDLMLVESFR